MMTVAKLINGAQEFELPAGMLWSDEYDWDAVEQSTQYTLDGSLYVQSGNKQAGRPITLEGGTDYGWMERQQVEELYQTWTQQQYLQVNYHGRLFTVIWRHQDKGITATPVVPGNVPSPTEPMVVTLRFAITA